MTEKATFAAGCFWHVEAAFREVEGVVSTQVGYTGGNASNPSYEEVCTGMTGHAEAVEVTYQPSKVSYEQLLKIFWAIHEPTQKDRQGPDIGAQYRSAIFYHSENQRKLAEASKNKLQQSQKYKGKTIFTEILPATEFYRAEEYHQKYLNKNSRGVCHVK